ncbi:hypothetical protein ABMA58_00205 [Oceanospirillum sp. HFRX-1_2]
MAISDQAYQKWLQAPSVPRVLLAELHHADGIEYVADRPFISRPNDENPNCIYNDVLSAAVDVTSRLDAQTEIGDLQLRDDGSISHWIGYQWRGHDVVLRLGSPDWPLDDSRVIARQINAGIQTAERGSIVLGVYDATAKLDQPIQRDTMPDGALVPLVFGAVFGAEALQLDAQTLTYRVSQLPITDLIVRDGNGPVIGHTPDYTNGQFIAAAYTPRTMSCEIVEPHSTAVAIIQWVAQEYDLSVADLSGLPSYTLGLRYASEVTGRQILDDVCAAISAHWSIDLLGQIQVQRLTEPQVPDLVLYADDIEYGGIRLVSTQEPLAQLTLQYGRNHTPMTEVAGSIHDSDPALAQRLRSEWQSSSANNALSGFPLAPDHELSVALVNLADVQTELNHRLALRSVRRDVYELSVFRAAGADIVGKSVRVEHPRLQGRLGRIISARLTPGSERAVLEIWVKGAGFEQT